MQIHQGFQQLPKFSKSVITVGTFDGVHAAHKKILQQLVTLANEINGESVLVTFHPHPKHVLHSSQSDLQLLSTVEEKIELLKGCGIQHLVIVPFTFDFAKISATDYIEQFLVNNFHPKKIVVGFNHHFGNNREGNLTMLRNAGLKHDFEVIEMQKQMEDEMTISSTAVRKFLLEGNILEANKLLGREYLMMGKVVEGKKLGRTIGFPTANIEVLNEHKLIPADGVYVAEVLIDTEFYKGMMNIGIRPTVNGTNRTIEINLFDFDKNIYGETVKIFFHQRIREEKKFNGWDELKKQLNSDRIYALDFFKTKNLIHAN